jgi:hypothetical protein
MSSCRLLANKTEAQARQICLNCPLSDGCHPNRAGRCSRCGGNLFLDREEDGEMTWHCLQCGAVYEPGGMESPVESGAQKSVSPQPAGELSQGPCTKDEPLAVDDLLPAAVGEQQTTDEEAPAEKKAAPVQSLPRPISPNKPAENGVVRPKLTGAPRWIKNTRAAVTEDRTWFAPRDIIFQRDQVIWVLANMELLAEGRWPPDQRETGYTETSIRGTRSIRAPFEKPVQIFAEITTRLVSTREAGEALVDEVQVGINEYESLSRPARRALNYVSGWKRRRMSFANWKTQAKYRQSKRGDAQ